MDLLKLRKTLKGGFQKYRAVLVVILAGFLLMSLPESKNKPQTAVAEKPQKTFEQSLEALLEQIQGAGSVDLILSVDAGEMTVYQVNEDLEGMGEGRRRDTVIVTDENRREQGLIRQVTAPRYRGAVVLAEGADNPTVRLAIKQAVSSAAGLSMDKITVLKMK